eukprot:1142899-Pelagomonas_calceolata.AAC.4
MSDLPCIAGTCTFGRLTPGAEPDGVPSIAAGHPFDAQRLLSAPVVMMHSLWLLATALRALAYYRPFCPHPVDPGTHAVCLAPRAGPLRLRSHHHHPSHGAPLSHAASQQLSYEWPQLGQEHEGWQAQKGARKSGGGAAAFAGGSCMLAPAAAAAASCLQVTTAALP